jgi:hypothetical protein
MSQRPLAKPRTSTLLRRIFKTADIKDYIEKNATIMVVPVFHTYITMMCKERKQKKESIIKRACIERTYGYQLFNGTRKPSRDKALQLAIGFGLDLDETQRLLQIADKSKLYPRHKRDAAVIYCICHGLGMDETQVMLDELGLAILGDE